MTARHFAVLFFWQNSRWDLGDAIAHLMHGLESPGLGHRIVDPHATGLPVPGHLGNAIGPVLGLDSPGF